MGIQCGYSQDKMGYITQACLKIGYTAGKGPPPWGLFDLERDDNVMITWELELAQDDAQIATVKMYRCD